MLPGNEDQLNVEDFKVEGHEHGHDHGDGDHDHEDAHKGVEDNCASSGCTHCMMRH